MKTRIQRLLEGNVKPVRLDLSSVDFVDSSAIGALLSLYRATERNLTLVGPNPSVVRALELLRLGNLFSIEAG